ncbi:hypothetical protein CF327_g2985 [Tilletia walkeri]|nr:hypothetical protein CF327_g2985 [Tilletia walkeri]
MLRKEGRWFAQRMLALLVLVANADKVDGAFEQPGRLSDLWLQSLIDDLIRFHSLVLSNQLDSTVRRSRNRRSYQNQATMQIQQQKRSILEFKKHLGLNGKIYQMAAAPSLKKKTSAASILSLQKLFDQEVARVRTLATYQQELLFSSFPDVALLLDLSAVFKNIDYATTQVEHVHSRKRARESSEISPDQEVAAATTLPSGNDSSIKSMLEWELENDRLCFSDIGQLEAFKERTKSELQVSFNISGLQLSTLSPEDAQLVLQRLCIFCARASLFDQAVFFGELLLLLYRDGESRDPSLKNKLIMANAYGSLSILLRATRRKVDAVRAAEEGINILQRFLKSNSDLGLAALKTTNAKALMELGSNLYNTEIQITVLQKAYRVAGEAFEIFRQLADKQPTNFDVKRSFADVLLVQISASKFMIQAMFEYQSSVQFDCFLPLDDQLNQACAEQSVSAACGYCQGRGDQDLIHELLKKLGVNIVKAFITTAEQCIEISRVLVTRVPDLHEPLLANALLLRAELLSFYSPRDVDVFSEPVTLFLQLSEKFPSHFNAASEKAYVGFAKQQRRNADLEGAAVSFQNALEQVFGLLDQSTGSQTASERTEHVKRAVKIQVDRTLLCIQLEQYYEGWFDSNRVLKILMQEGQGSVSMKFVGSVAMRGCCNWLLGDSEKAFEDLAKVFQGIKDAQDAQDATEQYSAGALRFDIAEDAFEYCVGLGWYGAVQSSRGNHEAALEGGERAVRALRVRLSNRQIQLATNFGFDPIRQLLPHFLVLLAGTLLCMGRSEAAWKQVEESLQLNSDIRVDGSTVKTALLLKARLLEERSGRGHFKEAARIREEAKKIPSGASCIEWAAR